MLQRFLQFETHRGTNWLDVEAGLQLFGVVGTEPSDEVLPGFYPLTSNIVVSNSAA